MPIVTRRLRREFLGRCEALATGRLRLHTPEGHGYVFGTSGPEAEITIRDWRMVPALAARGGIGLGETYVAGLWETPSIESLVALVIRNLDQFAGFSKPSLLTSLKYQIADRLLRANSLRGAARNIRSHYDVGNEFYQLWLDPGMTYSAAIFAENDSDLSRAQDRKYDRILDRLNPGERILEIGCGWGGFAERAADRGLDVVAITNSPSQKAYADARLDGRAMIELRDYRKQNGRFDNIVSIEMIEAVGERYWPVYFASLKDRLAQGGRIVLQAITVRDRDFQRYRKDSDFIRRYTFPGGMLPSNAVIASQARRAGLSVEGSYAFGSDYRKTCRAWADRMRARSKRILRQGHDQRFLRSWLYYLEISAASFAVGRTSVSQFELTHADD